MFKRTTTRKRTTGLPKSLGRKRTVPTYHTFGTVKRTKVLGA